MRLGGTRWATGLLAMSVFASIMPMGDVRASGGDRAAAAIVEVSRPAAGEPLTVPGVGEATAPTMVPLVPARLLDGRGGGATVDGAFGGVGPVGGGSSLALDVLGRGGVPASGVAAVVLNVTVTQPDAAGYVTAYPGGIDPPLASNLNFAAGETVANLVVVKVGADGRVGLFSSATAFLIADVVGWLPAGPGYSPLVPARLLDGRGGGATVDGAFGGVGPVGGGSSLALDVLGRGGVPASGVAAVVLNVTVTQPDAAGYVTAYPGGIDPPLASNLNFAAGETVANLVVVKVGADGRVGLFSSATAFLIADVVGWLPAGPGYSPLVPARLLDGRGGGATVDGAFGGVGPVGGGSSLALDVLGRGGVPASGVAAVVLNVTVTQPDAAGYVTAYPGGIDPPLASNLNFAAGETVANLVVVKVGADGRVGLFSSATAFLIADVVGWFAANPNGDPVGTTVLEGDETTVGTIAPGKPVTVTSPLAADIQVGTIVATSTPETAYYGRVLSTDGTTLVTEPVTLSDIYPDLNVSVVADLATGQIAQGGAGPDVTLAATSVPEVQALSRLRADCKPEDAVSGSTDVWVTPVLEPGRFEWDADWSWKGISRLRAVYAPRLALTVETKSAVALECSAVVGLFGKNLPAITFYIGTVPVVITQHLSAKAQINFRVEASVESKVAVSAGLDFGFDYVDGKFSFVRGAFVAVGGEEPKLEVTGRLAVEVPVTYRAKAYGLLGFEGEIKPYAGVIYDPPKGKFPSIEAGVRGRLSVVFGLRVGPVSWELKHDFVDTDLWGPAVIWSRLGVTTPEIRAIAGLPAGGSLGAAGGRTPYTWSASSLPSGLGLTSSGQLTGTAPAAGTYNLGVTVRDRSGQTRTATIRLIVTALTSDVSDSLGKILRLPDGRSWYIDKRGGRHAVPDGGTYQCLTAQGVAVRNIAVAADLAYFTQYENTQCVRANPGNIVRHADGDSYYLDGWTLRPIPDGGSYRCREVNGSAVVNNVPRYWLLDLTRGANYTWSCWNATTARGKSVRASDGTSYYIDLRGGRHWMPNGGTYDCLVAQGKADYGNVVPKEWVDDLTEYEHAACVRANPGNIIRHNDGDSYVVNANWTRSWIKDGGSYECLRLNGHPVVTGVPRYYIDDLVKGADITSSCWNAINARGRSVRASDGTSWYIDRRGGRHWMPDGGTYECLVAQGNTDWGFVVPISWVDDLPQYEHAKCVRANPGNIIAHPDGDTYLIHPNWTRSWIKDGGVYNCLVGAGHAAVTGVPRYYVDDLTAAADLTFCPADRVLRLADGTSWYVGNDLVKHPVPNGGTYLCLTAWKGKQVVTVTQTQAKLFTTGTNQSCTVTEVNDRIVRVGDASWYVDGGGVRHWIPNGGTYLCLTAWKGKQVVNVSQAQVDAIPAGADQGCVVTEMNDRVIRVGGNSWYVDTGGVKHWIPNGGTFLCMTTWQGKGLSDVSQAQADAIPTGGNQGCSASAAANRVVRRADGTAYFVDGNLVKHWIPNGGTYNCARSVRGIPLIDGVSVGHTDALATGADYRCRVIMIAPGNWRYYIDASGQRFLIPGETNQQPYQCLAAKSTVYTYSNWNTINIFNEPAGIRATCDYD